MLGRREACAKCDVAGADDNDINGEEGNAVLMAIGPWLVNGCFGGGET
jgi:hypothetical protein